MLVLMMLNLSLFGWWLWLCYWQVDWPAWFCKQSINWWYVALSWCLI